MPWPILYMCGSRVSEKRSGGPRTYILEVVCTTIPRVLAPAAPHRSGHAAQSAWMANERVGIHGVRRGTRTTEHGMGMLARSVPLNLAGERSI